MKKIFSKFKTISKEKWISVITAVFLILLWEVAVDLKWTKSAFIVSPWNIMVTIADLSVKGELLEHIYITVARTLFGFIVGATAGLIIGIIIGWSKEARAILNPIVSLIYPLPKIALLPLIIMLVGMGEPPIFIIIVLGTFFPVLINCAAGVLHIDQSYFDAARSYRAGKMKIVTAVILPGSLHMTFAGMRLGIGMSLTLAVIAELTIATNGLGAFLWNSWQTFRMDRIYVAIVVIAILGLLLNYLLDYLSKCIIRWQEEK